MCWSNQHRLSEGTEMTESMVWKRDDFLATAIQLFMLAV